MDDRTTAVLQRIAQALGVPVSLLGVENDVRHAYVPAHAVSEERELLGLFQAVGDPNLRRACLDFVRDAARANAARTNDLAAG